MSEQHMPSIDEIFSIITIDRARKCKMEITLQDKNGDEVPIAETAQKITEYVSDKMKTETGNSCRQQIFPLMANTMVASLCKLLGPQLTSLLLSQDHVRYSFIHMMMVGFYLLKFIQKNDIQIHTNEHGISDDDLAMYDRLNTATTVTAMAASMGANPKEVIRELLRTGQIQKEDLQALGAENILSDESEEKKKSEAN